MLTGPSQLRALPGTSSTLSWLLPFWEKGWFRGKTLQHATWPRVATHLWNFWFEILWFSRFRSDSHRQLAPRWVHEPSHSIEVPHNRTNCGKTRRSWVFQLFHHDVRNKWVSLENHGETIGPVGPMGGLASSHCAANSQTAQRHGQRGNIPRLDIDRCRVDLEDLTQTCEHVLVMAPCERFHHWIDTCECAGGPRSCTMGQQEQLTARWTTMECAGTEFDASP